MVSVRARGALLGGALRCAFGEAPATDGAWRAGARLLRCASRASASSGWVGVRLSSAHGALSSGGSFYYHAELVASAAAPPLGPERGGTRVALLGAALKDAYTLRCRFDNASSASLGRLIDASQLECASPMRAIGAARVTLSMNAQQYAADGARYTYVRAWHVSSVWPSRVLSEGGTPLTVRGVGFASSSEAAGYVACRLGGAVRRASWAGASALVCNSTRSAAGESRVEVSVNAREYSADAARVQLVAVRVLDARPWSGPVGGATVVSVRARGSLLAGALRCVFGEAPASDGSRAPCT